MAGSTVWDEPPRTAGEVLRIHELCEALEDSWRGGHRPRLEGYLVQGLDLTVSPFLDLLIVEIQVRRGLGESPELGEYAARFAGFEPAVTEAFRRAGPAVEDLTTVYPAEPSPDHPTGNLAPYFDLGTIGEGGMGTVHRVLDPWLHREIALKVIKPQYLLTSSMAGRFWREARLTSQLQHPGVPPVHELGTLPDGRPYYTMKLVKGQTLFDLLQGRSGPSADLPRFLAIFEQVALAIAYAHSERVVHRDLKPRNIMVGAFGEVQVMDWGLAKSLGPRDLDDGNEEEPDGCHANTAYDDEDATRTGVILGTIPYMPPEQARGEAARLDERCDVFALGSILCAILTGEAAYIGGSRNALLDRAARGDLADAHDRLDRSGADDELIALAKACLAPEPSARPGCAAEVSRRMAGYQEAVRRRLHDAELAQVEAQSRAEEEGKRRIVADELAREARGRASVERSRRRRTAALAAASLSLIVLVGGLVLWSLRKIQVDERETDRLFALTAAALNEALAAEADEKPWVKVQEQARALRDWIDHASIGQGTHRSAKNLLARIEAEAHAAERDRALFKGIVSVRNLREEVGDEGSLEGFRRLFLVYGLDSAIDPEVVATALRQRPESVRIAFASGLDEAAIIAREISWDSGEWGRWSQLATAIDPDEARQEVRAAWFGEDEGRLRVMARDLERIDRLSPAAIALLARTVEGSDDRGLAIAVLRRGVARHLHDLWLNHGLASRLERTGPEGLAEAIGYYRVARQIEAGTGRALADLLDQRGQGIEAEMIYRESIKGSKIDFGNYYKFSIFLKEHGKSAEAKFYLNKLIDYCNQLIRINPGEASTYNDLGLALRALERIDEAIDAHSHAIRLKADLASAHHNLGIALEARQRLDEAVESFREANRLRPSDPAILYSLGLALRSQGRLEEALDAMKRAISLRPDFAKGFQGLGIVLRSLKQYGGAVDAHRQAIRLRPDHYASHLNLANCLRDLGQLDEAIAEFHKAIELKPDDALARLNLGIALNDKTRLDDAAVSFRRAIDLDPDLADAHIHLGWTSSQLGRSAEAEAAYRKAIQLQPNSGDNYHSLGRALSGQGRLDEAADAYRQATRLKPLDAQIHYNLGVVLAAQDLVEPALVEYQEAIRLQPDYAEAHCNEGQILRRLGRYPEALEALRIGHELGSRRPDWRYASAQWLARAERLVGLQRRLRFVLSGRESPTDNSERLEFAQMAYDTRLHAGAARLWAEAMEVDPQVAESRQPSYRYDAACAAALAAAGVGMDEPPTDEAERTRLRAQALDWLHAELSSWSLIAESRPQDRPAVVKALRHWQSDVDLSGVRDQAALESLSAAERPSWIALWERAAHLIRIAEK
ncbi:MAG: tetratricopeptide repeat protein [Isosphaeraceae bacterium]